MVSTKPRSRAGSVKFVKQQLLHPEETANKRRSFSGLADSLKAKLTSRSRLKSNLQTRSLDSKQPMHDSIAVPKAKHRQSTNSIALDQESKRRHISNQGSHLGQNASSARTSIDQKYTERSGSSQDMYKLQHPDSATSFTILSKPQASLKTSRSSSSASLAAKGSNLSGDSDDGLEVLGNVTLKNEIPNNYATLDLSPVVSGEPIKISPIVKKHKLPHKLHLHLKTPSESDKRPSLGLNIQNSASSPSWLSADNDPAYYSAVSAQKHLLSPVSVGGKRESSASSTTKQKSGGIISSLLNTLSLRSQSEPNDNSTSPAQSLSELQKSSNLLTPVRSDADSDLLASPSAESVSFKPVKKSLMSTLGQGGLTLESIMADNVSSVNGRLSDTRGNRLEGPTSDGIGQPLNEDIVSEDLQLSPSARNTAQFRRHGRSYRSVTESKAGSPFSVKMEHVNSGINGSFSKVFQKPCKTLTKPLLNVRGRSKTASATERRNPDFDFSTANTSVPMIKRSSRMTIDEGSEMTKFDSTNKDETNPSIQYSKKAIEMASRLALKFANDKRQAYFHGLFSEIPENEPLFEDFSCALKKDILVQGRLFVSSKHMAFYSNIIGLVTHIVVPWNKVLSIQKKKTVGIPNALQFSTLHDKYSFASFMSRDSTYNLIHKVWTNGPAKSVTGSMDTLDINLDPEVDSQDDDSDANEQDYENIDDGEMFNDEQGTKQIKDGNQTRKSSKTKGGNANEGNGDIPHEEGSETDSSVSDPENMVNDMEDGGNDSEKARKDYGGLQFTGPKHHPPTSSGYVAENNEVAISENNIINAPVGLVFDLLFGDNTASIKEFIKLQGNINISDIPKFTDGTRKYVYTKPLNGPIGPKQTQCHIEEKIEKKDFDTSIIIIQTSETPDVPSGNSFRVRTRFFLSWGPNDSTVINVYTSVIWSGKSWIKGAIERGTVSGQKQSIVILLQELRKKVQGGGKEKPKRKLASSKRHNTEKQTMETVKPMETTPKPAPSTGFMSQISGLSTILEMKFDLKTVLIIILFVILLFGRSRPAREFSYTLDSLTGNARFSRSPMVFPAQEIGSRRFLQSEADLWDWVDERHKQKSMQDQINDSMGDNTLSSPEDANIQSSALPDNRFDGNLRSVEQIGSKLKSQELESIVEMMEKRLAILKRQAQIAQDRENAAAE